MRCAGRVARVRRMLLERLLRPVGSLALGAIASGPFSTFFLRRVTLDDVARISAEQMVERCDSPPSSGRQAP